MANPQTSEPEAETSGQMTFFEHLVELRKRLIHSLIAIAIGAFVGVYVAKYVIDFITRPMLRALSEAHLDPKLVYTHPAGFFNLIITLGIYIGLVLASPVVLYQIWLFVAPALYKHERSAVTGFLFSTVFLFLGGIAFGYFVTLPYILKFLVSFQGPVVPMISINEYFDLTLLVLFGLGLVFELPVLVFFLSLFGIVTPQFLWKNVRYAILIIAIVAAIITPTPDAMTMLIFMAPMLGLYFVGIGVSAMVVRKKQRQLAGVAESQVNWTKILLIAGGLLTCLVALALLAHRLGLVHTASAKSRIEGNSAVKSPAPDARLLTERSKTPQNGDDAPPPEKTGGFDGKRAFAHVAKQVGFGPRPSASPAIAQLQQYLQSELTSYGCKVDSDDFHAETPIGRLTMKNIVAKIPGEKPGIIILATHYDTARAARDPNTGQVHPMPNFVGADDGGSSTAVMLELARLLCGKPHHYSVWITFFDGEEAMRDWSATDSCYGSRQMAATMAMRGDLPNVKAFLLADIVGTRNLRFRRDSASTPALVDLVWKTAARLGYSQVFTNDTTDMQDDHNAFAKRGVSVIDVINFENYPGGNLYYWHTEQDTLDKISPRSLAITGHVFLESLKQLESK